MKKGDNLFQQLQIFEEEINRLEAKVLELETRMEHLFQVERNHLIRVKNHEEVADDFIYQGKKFQDLTPDKAWGLYQNKDFDFILIDVSDNSYEGRRLPEALKIPWLEFKERFHEIQSRTTPIFIICEDGTSSVLACEFLVKRGYFNANNVSGGYKYWRGFRLEAVKNESA
ncbi:MAG TPA: rhodanese-like domain-containing protein [Bacteriovoracaceae bacterium]|nr:rhodanese-like domain-containing protein [Bacteriovoracaceae bacterium]